MQAQNSNAPTWLGLTQWVSGHLSQTLDAEKIVQAHPSLPAGIAKAAIEYVNQAAIPPSSDANTCIAYIPITSADAQKQTELAALPLFTKQLFTPKFIPVSQADDLSLQRDLTIYRIAQHHLASGNKENFAILDPEIQLQDDFDKKWPKIKKDLSRSSDWGLFTGNMVKEKEWNHFLYFKNSQLSRLVENYFPLTLAEKEQTIEEFYHTCKLLKEGSQLASTKKREIFGEENGDVIHLEPSFTQVPLLVKDLELGIIIFSNNRPFQLDGTIRSIQMNFQPISRITVLYEEASASHPKHLQLISQYPEIPFIQFNRPGSKVKNEFMNMFRGVVEQATATHLVLIDDQDLVTVPCNTDEFLKVFESIQADQGVLSLGKSTQYAIASTNQVGEPLPQPSLKLIGQTSNYYFWENEGVLPKDNFWNNASPSYRNIYGKEKLLEAVHKVKDREGINSPSDLLAQWQIMGARQIQRQKMLCMEVPPISSYALHRLSLAEKDPSETTNILNQCFITHKWNIQEHFKDLKVAPAFIPLNIPLHLQRYSYSQLSQDRRVLKFYSQRPNFTKKEKFFVDIGAFDGVELSNTYLLEKEQWKGICVEANPTQFEKCQKVRNCTVMNCAVYDSDDLELDFNIPANGNEPLAGITADIDYKETLSQSQIKVKSKKLTGILDSIKAPTFIEYLSLDTEGSELKILQGIDFNKYIFGLIDVEHNYQQPRRDEMRSLLEANGYVYVRENYWDDTYMHGSLIKE